MKRESRTVDRSHQVDSLTQRHLPLVDLLVDTRAELMELAIASGLKVLATMLEADRTAICGVRAYRQTDVATARASLAGPRAAAGGRHPSAATSVREGTRRTPSRCRPSAACPIASDTRSQRLTPSKVDQSHAAREAERQTVARRTDGPAMDRRRPARSGEGLSPPERPQGYAEARRRASCSRSATRHHGVSGGRRVECHVTWKITSTSNLVAV